MKLRKYTTAAILTAGLIFASPLFADKIGVTFQGNSALESSISSSLKSDGHEIVDISGKTRGVRLDSVSAASIGKATGAEIIVSGKTVGPTVVLKILSTSNDTVAGGAVPAKDTDAVVAQVKKILADNKAKLTK